MIDPRLARELLARHGSPLYAYDLDEVRRRADALRALLPPAAQLYYALKANPLPEVCATLRGAGCRVEVASPAELEVARAAGFAPGEVLCSGPGKTVASDRAALLAGVRCFSCDSWTDLARLAEAAAATGATAHALLRIHVGDAAAARAGTGAMHSHFGVAEDTLLAGAAERLARLRGVELLGIHVYSGTQIQGAAALGQTFAHAIELAERIAAAGVPLRVLDLGGGFPWPFATAEPPPSLADLRQTLARVDASRRATAGAELWFESGRHLVASCGTLLATVLDVKTWASGKRHLILDAGMTHLGGMAGLGRIHRAVATLVPLAFGEGAALATVDVMGPTDSPLDCIARGVELPALEPGDVVAIPNVGAYGLTASLVAFAGPDAVAEVCYRGAEPIAVHRLRIRHERVSHG